MKRITGLFLSVFMLCFVPMTQAQQACNPYIPSSTPTGDFADHGDGTVTHSRTGLMWQRCIVGQTWNAGTCTGSASAMNWSGALQAAVSAMAGGYSDWRLPNIKELQSIVEEKCRPRINDNVFPNTLGWGFWSASAFAGNSGKAWYFNFYSGDASYDGKDNVGLRVRLVRAGQSIGAFDALNPGSNGTPTTPLPQPVVALPLDLPDARNLVIVTHGWNSSTNAWPNALVDAICDKLGRFPIRKTGTADANVVGVDHSCKSPGTADWVVYAYNWSPGAEVYFGNANTPDTALAMAQWHGIEMADTFWQLNSTGTPWSSVHLIGHSAGAGFVDSFATHIKDLATANHKAAPKVMTTFLDAYCRNPEHCSYGEKADLAEQYVDHRWSQDGESLLWFDGADQYQTNAVLKNAYNFDVTALDNNQGYFGLNLNGVRYHAFPYKYYLTTAGGTPPEFDAYLPQLPSVGFAATWAPWWQTGDNIWSATEAHYSGFGKGDRCILTQTLDLGLGSCNASFTQRWLHVPASVNALNLQTLSCHAGLANNSLSVDTCALLGLQSATRSQVRALAVGATLAVAPPDPGMALLSVNLAQPANRIKFDYHFTQTGSGGGLQVFIQDDKMIFVTLQSAGDTSVHSVDWIDIPALTAGDQNLRVVVKPMGSDGAGVEVSNIQFENVALADFPDGGNVPAGWTQPAGSAAPWAVASDAAYGGTLSLKSGAVADNQKSELTYTADFPAGPVSFARKASSESGFDFLQFYIDGVLQESWSGELGWAVVSYPISAGTHTVLWRYEKNGSIAAGSDAAWIDNVTLPNNPGTATLSYPLLLAPGWNLLGNSLNQSLTVASVYGDPAVVTTVWKWDAANTGWQFYAPSMDASALQAYATSKNYGVLSTINPGEGYWVNANANAAMPLVGQTGIAFDLTAANLASGWNLVATGNDVTPSAFNLSLSATPPATGVIPLNLTTLWAWDNPLSQWYFYAPSLEASGGLANYITSKGYLDFAAGSKTLGNGTGFWVNRP